MTNVVANSERELAKEVAEHAMLVGWDAAIARAAAESGIPNEGIRAVLNRAAEYNDKADPNGRIPELDDWKIEKQGKSELNAARGPGKTPQKGKKGEFFKSLANKTNKT